MLHTMRSSHLNVINHFLLKSYNAIIGKCSIDSTNSKLIVPKAVLLK